MSLLRRGIHNMFRWGEICERIHERFKYITMSLLRRGIHNMFIWGETVNVYMNDLNILPCHY